MKRNKKDNVMKNIFSLLKNFILYIIKSTILTYDIIFIEKTLVITILILLNESVICFNNFSVLNKFCKIL